MCVPRTCDVDEEVGIFDKLLELLHVWCLMLGYFVSWLDSYSVAFFHPSCLILVIVLVALYCGEIKATFVGC